MLTWLIVACFAMAGVAGLGIFLFIKMDLEIIGTILSTIAGFALIGLIIWVSILGYNTIAAESRCKVLNEAFGKHYTPDQVLFADDLIKQTIEGQYNRIKLNVEKE